MVLRARAYWLREPGVGEIREAVVPDPRDDEVLVRTLHSAISRGTEMLVHHGRVPSGQWSAMRAPFQEGDFPGPVKYGYLNVGVVEAGPEEMLGRTVFCLHPHQSAYVVPASAVHPVPAEVPARRAVLAGTVETAVNALWDAAPLVGDRIAVVGGGMVGCAVAVLAARIPGATVTLVDIDASRVAIADMLGVSFATPESAPGELDLVVHTSASTAGLRTAMGLLATDGMLLELSWYGDSRVEIDLGGAFHARRINLRASQVGTVSPVRAQRRSHADRLLLALDLLRDPVFDALLTGRSAFDDLPATMAAMAGGQLSAELAHTIDYEER